MTKIKKLSFAALGILLIAAIYYFTLGASQISNKMKVQVNTKVETLQTQGFSVKEREVSEKKEHFVISFNEPEKMAIFLSKHGTQVSAEDMKVLQGLEIGVDISYLADIYSGVSIDLYPLILPDSIAKSTRTDEDKKVLAQIEKMLDKKTFLVHVDINKLTSGFKGYMKDINEVLKTDVDTRIVMNTLTFSGDIKEGSITGVKQTLKALSIDVKDIFSMSLDGLKSSYVSTGDSDYEYKTTYDIDSIQMQEEDVMALHIQNFEALSDSAVKDALLYTTLNTKTKHFDLTNKEGKLVLDTFVFNIKADKLDIVAIEALGKVDSNNEKEMMDVLQKLVSKGIQLSIPEFSIANIETMGQKMEGFELNMLLDAKKSLDITALQNNPMLAVNAINANLELSLSKELFTLISQQPQAMMAIMLFQPKEVNGKKVYKLELKDAKFTVNGKAVM